MNQLAPSNKDIHWDTFAADPATLVTLSAEEQGELGTWLRDKYFALSSRERPQGGDDSFRALVAAYQPPPTVVIEGLSFHFHPTARHKLLRFVDEERIPLELRPLFARPVPALEFLCAVFVDPEELSYRTFREHHFARSVLFPTVSLDFVRSMIAENSAAKVNVIRSDCRPPTRQSSVCAASMTSTCTFSPLNASSRGGERFIFHSARLSEVFTTALRSALPKSLVKNFSHVNPVFRANRFEPGDNKFHRHTDTPYYDAAQKQVSRYNAARVPDRRKGNATLRNWDDVTLDQIEAMTCVVFDQSFEHEGAAYEDGKKLFLRSELIFTDSEVVHDSKIGELFAKACYLTGESIFAPELNRFADDCYNRVARAHFAGLSDEERHAPTPWVHKEFRGVHFVASGYDFWFPKGHLTLQECAAIAVLDSFNSTIAGTTFHKLCTTEVLPPKTQEAEWIPQLLSPWRNPQSADSALGTLDKGSLFPPSEDAGSACCPFHANMRFDATRCGDIIEYFDRAQKLAKKRVFAAPIVLMGQEIFLDAAQFVVESGRIHILSEQQLAPVNFAACWNFGGDPSNYVDVAQTVEVMHPLVPPILFVETADCYHLMFDFFRNAWMVKPHQYEVPIPRISDINPGDAEENGKTPWLTAAKRAHVRRGKKGGGGPWWGETSSGVMAELYPADEEDSADE